MKRWILCAGIFLAFSAGADAQSRASQKGTNSARTLKSAPAKKNLKTGAAAAVKTTAKPGSVTRTSIGAYAAKASPAPLTEQYRISDPLVRALDARAHGAPVRISGSGVVGMPRRSYGIANGRITFLPQGSRTTGSITGSGAVGTGTSPGVISSGGPAMGLNGKNPYSGSGVYGSWSPGFIRPDSLGRGNVPQRSE